ncbi:hypothetical protein [Tepidibacillus sp. LV47]|uniref:hypothetical protein n=1 Tax=Tepidibacillus sp. LV47 TaxID=3398228 RepID=UPI003AABA96E
METRRTKTGDFFEEIGLFRYTMNSKGFTYVEFMIMISFFTFLVGYLYHFLILTQKEKEEQRTQFVLQHSYHMGYNYLKSSVLPASRFFGGGQTLYIESKSKLEAFRFDGVKVIREVKKGEGALDGTVIVFEYVDSIRFEILPNGEGIHLSGRLKLADQVFSFDDFILKRVQS